MFICRNSCKNKVSLVLLLSSVWNLCFCVNGLWSNPLPLFFFIRPRLRPKMAQSRSLLLVVAVVSSCSLVYALPPFTLWLISQTVVKGRVARLHGGYVASSYYYHGSHKMLQVSFYFYWWSTCVRSYVSSIEICDMIRILSLGAATQDEVLYYSWEIASIHGVSGPCTSKTRYNICSS